MKIWHKSPTDELEIARRRLEHASMRRALYEVVWTFAHPPKGNVRARPCPPLSDKEIKAWLKGLIND